MIVLRFNETKEVEVLELYNPMPSINRLCSKKILSKGKENIISWLVFIEHVSKCTDNYV